MADVDPSAGPRNKARKMGTDFVAAEQAEIDQENRLAAQSVLSRKREPRRLFASKMTLCFSANLCVSTPRNPKTGQSSGTRSAISSGKTKLNTISGQAVARFHNPELKDPAATRLRQNRGQEPVRSGSCETFNVWRAKAPNFDEFN